MLLKRNKDLYDTITALAGVGDFTTQEKADLVSLTNRRLSMAYNKSPMWDRYIVIGEEREIATIKVEGADIDTYNGYYIKNGKTSNTAQPTFADADVFVKSDNKSFVFFKKSESSGDTWRLGIIDTLFTHTPITDITTFNSSNPSSIYIQDSTDEGDHGKPSGVKFWQGSGLNDSNKKNLIVSDVTTVLYDSLNFPIFNSSLTIGNENTINDFHRIHQDEPFLKRSATEFDYYVDTDGAHISNLVTDTNTVYVTYKKHIANTTTGKIITSLDTDATDIFIAEIPAEFFNYTAHGVYADFLRMDGQTEKAAFEEEKAELFLATELERVDIINNNNSLNRKISTYVNRTLR
jgi:hypothetical protein